jgi:hypothetical protein
MTIDEPRSEVQARSATTEGDGPVTREERALQVSDSEQVAVSREASPLDAAMFEMGARQHQEFGIVRVIQK